MAKDEVKPEIARLVQDRIFALAGIQVEGVSHPFGCGEVAVKSTLETRVISAYITTISIKTPCGPRFFEVKFKESY